ncbi:MAG: glycosyltransferase [Butyribacter sp.]|uniref:glycosyltransferase family protein n=1 Tax=Butyribacter intestini TaxID=1703332 RepID=UPI003A280439
MKKHIIILKKGNVCYGSTSYFAERINEELKKTGISSEIVDINSKEDAERFVQKYERIKEVTDIIDFNTDIFSYMFSQNYYDNYNADNDVAGTECAGGSVKYDRENYIFDIKNDSSGGDYVKLWHIILDHPLYHNSVLRQPLKNMRVVCLDETHAEYIRKYYSHIKEVIVMPLPADTAKSLVTYNERSRDVLFTGTYTSSEDIVALAMRGGGDSVEIKNFQTMHKEPAQEFINSMQIFNKMAGYLLENPCETIEKAYTFALGDITEEKVLRETAAAFADGLELNFLADMFIRAVIREELLMEMLRNGIDVDIFGHGWEKFVEKCGNVEKSGDRFKGKINICGEVDYRRLPELYADTKIALNVLPWFKAGQHDRIALAMCNGCVCVTDESTYLEKKFVDGENIFMYSLEDMTGAAMLVRDLLAHPLEAARAAAKGYVCAVSSLSFKKYIEIFIN